MSVARLVALGIVATVCCLGGETDRPIGSRCSSAEECDRGLVCAYGHCRAACELDRDCPEGTTCVARSPGSAERICTLVEEGQCEPTSCPGESSCVIEEGLCHDGCTSDADCGPGRECDLDEGVCRDLPEETGGCLLPDVDAIVAAGCPSPRGTESLPAILVHEESWNIHTESCVLEETEGDTVAGCHVETSGGQSLCLFVVGSLEVITGAGLFVRGPDAVVVISAGALMVDGSLYIQGGGSPGPGGGSGGGPGEDGEAGVGRGGAGGSGGASAGTSASGGGGGGLEGSGGTGGCFDPVGGGEGGGPEGSCAEVALLGGPGGGGGGGGLGGGAGGHGAGALYLLSLESISVGGIIWGNGGPGEDGSGTLDEGAGGGGAGSGGTVVLEAPVISVSGVVMTIGGDGGRAISPPGDTAGGSGGGEGGEADGTTGSCTEAGFQEGGGGGGGVGRVFVLADEGGLDFGEGIIAPDDQECLGHRRQCLL